MFDSPVFNIVIGLTLIFLLYSLLATLLGELISTALNFRSTLLRIAIERMLNDGYYNSKKGRRNRIGYAVGSYFRWLFLKPDKNFHTSLAAKFYNHPSIKYLSKAEGKTLLSERRPSYLTDVYFVSTLTRMLSEMGLGTDENARIASALKLNTLHMQAQTIENIRGIYREANGDLGAFKEGLKKWYNETMERANGWYKRKMQRLLLILGLILAVGFNIDSIRIAKILSADTKARTQLVNIGIALTKDSAYNKVVNIQDSITKEAILDSGYAKVMDDINNANLLLGLGWDFKSLSSEIKYTISTPSAKDSFFRIRENIDSVKSRYAAVLNQLRQDRLVVDTIEKQLPLYERDILIAGSQLLKGISKDSTSIKKLMKTKRNAELLMAAQYKMLSADSNELKQLTAKQQQNVRAVSTLTNTDFIRLPAYEEKGNTVILRGETSYTGNKLWYIVRKTFQDYRLLGFLLTTLMLSLGAPFWFDLLKKLVNLRGVGLKPLPSEDVSVTNLAKQTTVAAIQGNLQPVALPVFSSIQDEFVWRYKAALMAFPAIRAVFCVYDNTGAAFVQINIINTASLDLVNKHIFSLGFSSMPDWLQIKVTGAAKANNLTRDQSIGNNNNIDTGFGSLSLVLTDHTNADRFVLSCWHVLKGDIDYDATSIAHKNIRLFQLAADGSPAFTEAILETGGITETLDYGIARCTTDSAVPSNNRIKQLLKITGEINHRPVGQPDLVAHTEVKFYDIFSGKIISGVIYTSCPELQVDYQDKSRIVQDVLVIMKDVNTVAPISKPGNSGAVLFDAAGVAIGMIVAGDESFTYAIKLSNFFNLHKEKKSA